MLENSSKLLVENYPYAIMVVVNEKIQHINPKFTQLFNFTLQEVKGKPVKSLISPTDHKYFEKSIINGEIEGNEIFSKQFSLRMLDKTGQEIEVTISKTNPLTYEGKKSRTFIIYSRSILGFEMDNIERANRSLRALTEIIDIVEDFRGEVTLHEITEILVNTGGYRMCWIGKIDPNDPSSPIIPISISGFEDGYLDNTIITWDDTVHGNGPTGQSIKTKKPVISRAIPSDPKFSIWRKKALDRGYFSSASIPIIITGVVYGTINIYSSFPDAFNKEELDLLIRISKATARGLYYSSLESKYLKMDDTLQYNEQQLQDRITELNALYSIATHLNTSNSNLSEKLDQIIPMIDKALGFEGLYSKILVDRLPARTRDENNRLLIEREITINQISRAVLQVYSKNNPNVNKTLFLKSKTNFVSHVCEMISTTIKNTDNLQKIKEQNKIIEQSKKIEILASLAGGIAHDFNKFITIILGYTDLLLEKPIFDESMVDYIKKIRQSSESAARMTQKLLAIGTNELYLETINVNDHIRQYSTIIDLLIPKSIEVSYILSKEPIYLTIDRSDLDQILMNLVINAKDAIKQYGNIRITTELKSQGEIYPPSEIKQTPHYFVLSVEDNGKGITPEVKNQIFELFFTTKKYGTGLGLVNVQAAVNKYNGWIDVASEVNQFTRFDIYIPQFIDQKTRIDPRESTGEKEIIGKILLIEDDPDIRTIICKSLSKRGFDITALLEKNDVEEFIVRNINEIDTIISDIVLPDYSSIEIIEKAQERNKDINFLFISGYGQDILDRLNNSNIAFKFLKKPFTISELVEKLKSM